MAVDPIVRTYDPKKIIVTFGGNIIIGFADGAFVNVEPAGPGFDVAQGADGSIDRVNKNMNHYLVTVTLKRTSPTNNALSIIHTADKASNTGKLPLTIKDLQGTSLLFAAQAWIVGFPSAEESSDMPSREWQIQTGIATNLVGGNST